MFFNHPSVNLVRLKITPQLQVKGQLTLNWNLKHNTCCVVCVEPSSFHLVCRHCFQYLWVCWKHGFLMVWGCFPFSWQFSIMGNCWVSHLWPQEPQSPREFSQAPVLDHASSHALLSHSWNRDGRGIFGRPDPHPQSVA